jgi:hypothetical protein
MTWIAVCHVDEAVACFIACKHARSVEALDVRERETRERLIYLEGVIAGARERAAAARPRLEDDRG